MPGRKTPPSARTPERAFGLAVKALRDKRGLTQEALAHKAGLHPTTISVTESGLRSPSLRTMTKIAEVLGVEASAILRRAEAILKRSR